MTFPKHIINGTLCYLFHEGQVLLLKRNRPPHIGLWSAPGGKSEIGESPQDTVVRELHEETGLTIINPTLRALQTSVDVHYPAHWMLYIFVATQFTGSLIDSQEGELRWFSFIDVADLPRPDADKMMWEHLINPDGGLWQGKFVYDTPERLLEMKLY